jgi:hypothetical protein
MKNERRIRNHWSRYTSWWISYSMTPSNTSNFAKTRPRQSTAFMALLSCRHLKIMASPLLQAVEAGTRRE